MIESVTYATSKLINGVPVFMQQPDKSRLLEGIIAYGFPFVRGDHAADYRYLFHTYVGVRPSTSRETSRRNPLTPGADVNCVRSW